MLLIDLSHPTCTPYLKLWKDYLGCSFEYIRKTRNSFSRFSISEPLTKQKWREAVTTYYRNRDESKAFTGSFILQSPNYSECAYIGRRPLKSLSFLPSTPYNRVLDRANLELAHQHIIFANSGDNIGLSHKGLFSEDVRNKKYSLEPTCFEGAVMRRAIALSDI